MKKIFSIILLISFLFQGYAYAQPPMFAGVGDLVGPASSTDNTIPRYDGTTGKLLQGSSVTIDDSNNISIPGDITVTGSDATIGVAGVKLTGDGDGAITFLGLGNGSDEDIILNLDDVSNTVGISSSTGVTSIDLTSITIPGGDIANTPAGTIAATDVQTAINELDTEKSPLASPTFTGILTMPAGSVTAPSIVSDDADSGFYFGSKGFNWGVDGTKKFGVDSSGTVSCVGVNSNGGIAATAYNGYYGDNYTVQFVNSSFTQADNMIEMAYGTTTFTGFDGEIVGINIMPPVGVLDDGDTMTLLKLSPTGIPASTLGIVNGLAFGNWGGTGTDTAYMVNLSATGYDYLIYDNNFSVTDAGQGYFAGNVGIGMTPGTKLDIADDSIDAGFRIRHSNLSQGISIGYNTILANGSGANLDINITSKGTGAVKLSKTAMSNSAVPCAATVCTDVPESYAIYLTTTGIDTMTLADGTNAGQEKYISHKVDGGQVTITPTNFSGGTNIVLTAAGDNVKLHWNGTKWDILSTYRGTVN